MLFQHAPYQVRLSVIEDGGTEAEFNNLLRENTGYSSLSEYIDAIVDEMFASHQYTYSFSTDGNSLFMQEMPQPKGTDELANKTYNGTMWDDVEEKWVKYTGEEYVFGANKTYTHTYPGGGSETITETGSYSYDSTKKWGYFSIVTINGETAAQYYDTIPNDHLVSGFIDEAASRASNTNGRFSREVREYDPIQQLIGWF